MILLVLFQMELLYFPNFFLSHAEQYRWSVHHSGRILKESPLLKLRACLNTTRSLMSCTQVPDAVPIRRVGVSILPVLCQDQKTVDPVFATGENCERKSRSQQETAGS